MDNAHVLKDWLIDEDGDLFVASSIKPNGRCVGSVIKVGTKSNHDLPQSNSVKLTASCMKLTVFSVPPATFFVQQYKFTEAIGERRAFSDLVEVMQDDEVSASKIKGTFE